MQYNSTATVKIPTQIFLLKKQCFLHLQHDGNYIYHLL
jgi:hypothetical protein